MAAAKKRDAKFEKFWALLTDTCAALKLTAKPLVKQCLLEAYPEVEAEREATGWNGYMAQQIKVVKKDKTIGKSERMGVMAEMWEKLGQKGRAEWCEENGYPIPKSPKKRLSRVKKPIVSDSSSSSSSEAEEEEKPRVSKKKVVASSPPPAKKVLHRKTDVPPPKKVLQRKVEYEISSDEDAPSSPCEVKVREVRNPAEVLLESTESVLSEPVRPRQVTVDKNGDTWDLF
jgi:hypothetical protein